MPKTSIIPTVSSIHKSMVRDDQCTNYTHTFALCSHRFQMRMKHDRFYQNQSTGHIDVWSASTSKWERVITMLSSEVTSDFEATEKRILDAALRVVTG